MLSSEVYGSRSGLDVPLAHIGMTRKLHGLKSSCFFSPSFQEQIMAYASK